MFYLSYIGWIFYIAFAGGIWVYPILEYLDAGQRAGFIGVCTALAICLYLMEEACQKMVWGKECEAQDSFRGDCSGSLSQDTTGLNTKPKKKRKYI